ncbi:aspartoacylase family-domain-containing protein [Elsinoe ampelina]|uniref:Aspartoacylase family-domain-containing protein n=1 Tax=Elsinoe ampelina TaxID=302913 RepID=A0A6A6G2J0_9PEZI|nr:aspartoacylase family-domain-containing protein [Elsinoe ampelina]
MKLTTLFLTAVSLALTTAQNFTGDIISGNRVITQLNLADVPSSAVTRYWLEVPELSGGLRYYVPVVVARGPPSSLTNGQTLSLSSTIHGDELNGVRISQRIIGLLEANVSSLNGTVIIIPTINRVGISLASRFYRSSASSGTFTDLNRLLPGSDPADGASAPSSLVYTIWNNVWSNATIIDQAIDLHTVSTGSDGPLWCYADFRLPGVERLAKLTAADVIKIDPGEPGSVETTFIRAGVPAITLEVGAPRQWRKSLIDRSVAYIERVLADMAILPSSSPVELPDLSDTYIGTTFGGPGATAGGFVETLVDVLDDVTEGQEIARIYNVFGDVAQSVLADATARVLSLISDPAVEQGRGIATLIYNETVAGNETIPAGRTAPRVKRGERVNARYL